LKVKSRRSASSSQSSVKATTARRPSVSTSRRRVVSSYGRPSTIAVTVPCFRPVGTVLIFAAWSARITVAGGADTAMSMSMFPDVEPSTASRTQPPTKRASTPPAVSAANRRSVAGSRMRSGNSILSDGFIPAADRPRRGSG
jgi:hypothetical protein